MENGETVNWDNKIAGTLNNLSKNVVKNLDTSRFLCSDQL